MKLSRKGFTLIELIIFIVVGAIILPASFVAFTAAIKHFSTPDYYVKARFYAEQKMEMLTSYTYTDPALDPGPGSDTPETGYPRTWNISFIDSTLAPSSNVGYKKIDISVTMPDGSIYDVSTIVTRRPKS
jgi:prepilin-type N-terminal cleavage/methylation domain-containing protein